MDRPNVAADAPVGDSTVEADYFDGRSARARPVRLRWLGQTLLIRGDGVDRDVAPRDVRFSERTRHGPRVAHLSDGGSLQGRDRQRWDDWLRETGQRDSIVVSVQQSWRWTLAGVAGVLLVLVALGVWGIPWLSRAIVLAIPGRVDKSIGDATLSSLDEHLLRPSALDASQRQRIASALQESLAVQPARSVPAYLLVFRSSRLGANAFALPGGTIVMTDQLVKLFEADARLLTGVLAHELGHVRHRHGMRMVVQSSLLAVLSSVVLGDFSGLLVGAPVLLGQQSYSRDAEREADAHCAAVLKAAGVSPAVMVGFFEKMNALRGEKGKSADAAATPSWLGIAIASHPVDAERIAFFRAAAAR